MKKFLLSLMLLLQGQNAFAMNVDATLDRILAPISDTISGFIFFPLTICGAQVPVVIFWILIAGIFFTLYLRGIAIWGFPHAFKVLTKKVAFDDEQDGEVSSAKALATALSGTIGLGSIAGVAIAISIGGPGAAFWILMGAILGMSLKFVEASLALKYRRFNPDGTISGGPMHYIAHGLTRKKLRWLGQPLSVIFAICCIGGALTGGNMIQVNQTVQQIINITGADNSFLYGYGWVIGLTIAIILGLIVMGGLKSIANVTSKMVPAMCMLYIVAGLIVIFANFTHIFDALKIIVTEAFFPKAVAGGIFGTIIIGLRRSVQSNEAGTGSAPIVYAAVQTKEPMSQGFVSLLEPFLTGLLCTLSAFAIVITGQYLTYSTGISGIELTSAAFSQVISFFPIILSIVVVLFALSTIISWAYYGQKAWTFLVGEGKKRIIFFQLFYCTFVLIGSVMNVKSVIDLTDALMISMCIPNIIAMYILAPEIKKDMAKYCIKHNIAIKFNSKWYKNLLKDEILTEIEKEKISV